MMTSNLDHTYPGNNSFFNSSHDGLEETQLDLNPFRPNIDGLPGPNRNCSDSLHEKTKNTSQWLRNVSMGGLFSRLVEHVDPSKLPFVKTKIPEIPKIDNIWECLKTIVSFSDLLVEKLTAPLEIIAIGLQLSIGGENVIRLSRLVTRILATAALIAVLSVAYLTGYGLTLGVILTGLLIALIANTVWKLAKGVGGGIYNYIIKPLSQPCYAYIAHPLYLASGRICKLVSTPFYFIADKLNKRHLRANIPEYLAAEVQLLKAEVAVLQNQDNDRLKDAYNAANYNFEKIEKKFEPIKDELKNMGQHGALSSEQQTAIFRFAREPNTNVEHTDYVNNPNEIISNINGLKKKYRKEMIANAFKKNGDSTIDFNKAQYDEVILKSENTTWFSSLFGRSTTTANTTSSDNSDVHANETWL
jgi:hypothetical protein